jgi:hypothetical protein
MVYKAVRRKPIPMQYLATCCDGMGYDDVVQRGETPLHEAAWNGHLQAAKLLLTSGAAVDAPTNVSAHG